MELSAGVNSLRGLDWGSQFSLMVGFLTMAIWSKSSTEQVTLEVTVLIIMEMNPITSAIFYYLEASHRFQLRLKGKRLRETIDTRHGDLRAMLEVYLPCVRIKSKKTKGLGKYFTPLLKTTICISWDNELMNESVVLQLVGVTTRWCCTLHSCCH